MPASVSERGFGATARHRKPRSSGLCGHRATYEHHVAPWRSVGRLEAAEPILNLLAQSQTQLAAVYSDLEALARARGDEKAGDRFRDLWLENPSEQEAELLAQAATAQELGRVERAVQLYWIQLRRHPGHPQATLAIALQLLRQEAFLEARQLLGEVVGEPSHPGSLDVTALQAVCAVALQEPVEAIRLARRSLTDGQSALAQSVLAAAFHQQGREEEAWAHLQRARDLCSDPASPPWPIPRLLSRICLEQNRLSCAEPLLLAACRQEPTSRQLQHQFGELLLLQGHLTAGFRQWARSRCPQPLQGMLADCELSLDLGAFGQGPVHLVAEGTLGDTLLFSRYAPWIADHLGQAVHFYVQPPVMNLLRYSFHHGIGVHPLAQLPRHETNQVLPLLMAPAYFGACDQEPNLRQPCLKADPQRVAAWRQRLNLAAGERLIAINWHGSAMQALRERVSSDIPLQAFAGLAELPNVRLLSLQKGFGVEQLRHCSFLHRFVACQEEINREHRLEEMAALISLCDWVVCDDSGPAHLAGSLGRPTLLLLSERGGWRWGSSGDDCLWYPTLQILRRTAEISGWETLVEQAANTIQQETGSL